MKPDDLSVADGVIRSKSSGKQIAYVELLGGTGFGLKLDKDAPLKSPADYTIVGKPIARLDIPGKVTGTFTYMQDVRVPGMLHGRVIHPLGDGATLVSVDEGSVRGIPGIVKVVRDGNFVGVVAKTEWAAIKAARQLKVKWSAWDGLPPQNDLWAHVRSTKVVKEEVTSNTGDVAAALQQSTRRMKATYDFAIHTHGSIGPSAAIADYSGKKLTVWTASQASHALRTQLAQMFSLPDADVRCIYADGAGCYGRNGHEDAASDAALLSRAVEKPVRVQWMRADETARAPKSPPRAMDMEGGFDKDGNLTSWSGDFYIAVNHIVAFKPLDFPLLAATDVGLPKPGNWVGFLFQNAAAPYALPNISVKTKHVAETFFRSAHLRSPGRIENSFANESFIDELAADAKADPAEFRIKHVKDPRALAVINAAMKRSGWASRVGTNASAAKAETASGRGIAYIRYNNTTTYVAAVAEVEVNRTTGEVRVKRVCVGHDCGQIINPDGLANQIEGGVIQTVSRTLIEEVQWDREKVTSVDWASYPILRFPQVPRVEVDMINVPGEVSWGAGEPTATAIPAAIANAIYDATGARLRSIPITADKVKAAIAALGKTA